MHALCSLTDASMSCASSASHSNVLSSISLTHRVVSGPGPGWPLAPRLRPSKPLYLQVSVEKAYLMLPHPNACSHDYGVHDLQRRSHTYVHWRCPCLPCNHQNCYNRSKDWHHHRRNDCRELCLAACISLHAISRHHIARCWLRWRLCAWPLSVQRCPVVHLHGCHVAIL